MTAIRVLVVDDQDLIRTGLRRLLEIEPGIEVAGEAADGTEALAAVAAARPDVALVDARMPGMDGVELIGRLAATHPAVACLVLSTFDEDTYIFGALRAGAYGYVLKDCAPEDLTRAIRKVHAGETVLDGPAAARVVAPLRRHRPPAAEFPGADLLSPREREVVSLVAAGYTNREIAASLLLTEGTIKNHVSSALRKLSLRDRTQLAVHVHG